jgi:hypothetical protein
MPPKQLLSFLSELQGALHCVVVEADVSVTEHTNTNLSLTEANGRDLNDPIIILFWGSASYFHRIYLQV